MTGVQARFKFDKDNPGKYFQTYPELPLNEAVSPEEQLTNEQQSLFVDF